MDIRQEEKPQAHFQQGVLTASLHTELGLTQILISQTNAVMRDSSSFKAIISVVEKQSLGFFCGAIRCHLVSYTLF